MSADDLPVLRVKGQDSAVVQQMGSALGAALNRAAKAASLAPLVAEDLLRHLHQKLHVSYRAQRRMRSLLGKVLVVMVGDDPDYIEMGGSHLRQTLSLLGVEEPADGIDGYQTYLLRVDVAREAHDLLGAQLDVEPEVLRQGLD